MSRMKGFTMLPWRSQRLNGVIRLRSSEMPLNMSSISVIVSTNMYIGHVVKRTFPPRCF